MQRITSFLLAILLPLLSLFCLTISCGKKGEPTLKAYEKPPAPVAFRAIHREEALSFLWNFSKDDESSIEGFVLLKSKPGDSEEVIKIEREHRSYIDTDIALQTKYTYTIFSKNLKGVMSDEIEISVLPSGVPPAPKNVSFHIGTDELKLTWSCAGDAIVYNVYKSSKSNQYGFTPVNVKPLSSPEFTDRLDTKNSVYYIIRSLRTGPLRDEGPASEEIKIAPASFIPSAPIHLQAVQTKGLIRLIWKEPPEPWITAYKIYRKSDKEDQYQYIGKSSTPTFLDPDNQQKRRNYRVTAVGPVSEGLPAELENVVLKKIQ